MRFCNLSEFLSVRALSTDSQAVWRSSDSARSTSLRVSGQYRHLDRMPYCSLDGHLGKPHHFVLLNQTSLHFTITQPDPPHACFNCSMRMLLRYRLSFAHIFMLPGRLYCTYARSLDRYIVQSFCANLSLSNKKFTDAVGNRDFSMASGATSACYAHLRCHGP